MDNLYIARQLSSKISEIILNLKRKIVEQYNLKFYISQSENTLTIYNENLTYIFVANLDIDYLFYMMMPDNMKKYLLKIKKGEK
tara:strand:- start:13073 stop:13324 length:252 start_codon:yes stop_codon:yes gene_type:complete